MFKGKTLLITGGTGSFGNAVLKRFLHTDIQEIRIFLILHCKLRQYLPMCSARCHQGRILTFSIHVSFTANGNEKYGNK